MTLASLRSWQTTVAGVLSAVGLVAQVVLELSEAPTKLRMVAAVVNAVTLAALGILARDNTKTSEDVGAAKATPAAPAAPAAPADAVKAAVEAIPGADVSVIAAAVQEALKAGQAARAAEEPRDRPTSPEEPR